MMMLAEVIDQGWAELVVIILFGVFCVLSGLSVIGFILMIIKDKVNNLSREERPDRSFVADIKIWPFDD
jgi:hypothetical protein